MVSQAKQLANEMNAGKSTGPRTEAGKHRSSQNRLRHGFFSARVVLEGEDRTQYDALLADLVDEHRPQTPTQMGCVQRVADCTWKLWRIEGSAAHVHERRAMAVRHEAAQWAANTADALDGGGAGAAQLERWATLWHADEAQLRRMRDRFARLVAHAPGDATLAASMVESHHSPGGAGEFDRLARYEQRLQNMLHRALNELRKLRKERAEVEALPTSPYATERNENGDDGTSQQSEKVRNEPTVSSSPAGSPSVILSPDVRECAAHPKEWRNEPTADRARVQRASSQ